MRKYLGNLRFCLICSLLMLTSCSDQNVIKPTIDSIKMVIEADIEADTAMLDLVLTSKEARTLSFDGAMFIAGCSYYAEYLDTPRSAPILEDFKYSQLLIENEKHEWKVYSWGQYDDGVTELASCFDVDTVMVNLIPQERYRLFFGTTLPALRINREDKKIRIHLYYKDDEDKDDGFIVSSENWIILK